MNKPLPSQPITFISKAEPSKPAMKVPVKKTPPIPSGEFTTYLDAWRFKRDTGCKREIKKLGHSKFVV